MQFLTRPIGIMLCRNGIFATILIGVVFGIASGLLPLEAFDQDSVLANDPFAATQSNPQPAPQAGGVTFRLQPPAQQAAVQPQSAPTGNAENSDSIRQAEDLFIAGAEAEQIGNNAAAEQTYRQCLQFVRQQNLNGFETPVIHRLAILKAKEKQYDQSEAYFRQIVPHAGENVPLLCDYAKLYMNQKRYAEAETILKNVILFAPNNRQVLYNLGYVIAIQPDRQTEGLRYMKLAIGEKDAYREIAKIYRLHGNENQATFAEQKATMTASASGTPTTSESMKDLQDHIKKELMRKEAAELADELEKDGSALRKDIPANDLSAAPPDPGSGKVRQLPPDATAAKSSPTLPMTEGPGKPVSVEKKEVEQTTGAAPAHDPFLAAIQVSAAPIVPVKPAEPAPQPAPAPKTGFKTLPPDQASKQDLIVQPTPSTEGRIRTLPHAETSPAMKKVEKEPVATAAPATPIPEKVALEPSAVIAIQKPIQNRPRPEAGPTVTRTDRPASSSLDNTLRPSNETLARPVEPAPKNLAANRGIPSPPVASPALQQRQEQRPEPVRLEDSARRNRNRDFSQGAGSYKLEFVQQTERKTDANEVDPDVKQERPVLAFRPQSARSAPEPSSFQRQTASVPPESRQAPRPGFTLHSVDPEEHPSVAIRRESGENSVRTFAPAPAPAPSPDMLTRSSTGKRPSFVGNEAATQIALSRGKPEDAPRETAPKPAAPERSKAPKLEYVQNTKAPGPEIARTDGPRIAKPTPPVAAQQAPTPETVARKDVGEDRSAIAWSRPNMDLAPLKSPAPERIPVAPGPETVQSDLVDQSAVSWARPDPDRRREQDSDKTSGPELVSGQKQELLAGVRPAESVKTIPLPQYSRISAEDPKPELFAVDVKKEETAPHPEPLAMKQSVTTEAEIAKKAADSRTLSAAPVPTLELTRIASKDRREGASEPREIVRIESPKPPVETEKKEIARKTVEPPSSVPATKPLPDPGPALVAPAIVAVKEPPRPSPASPVKQEDVPASTAVDRTTQAVLSPPVTKIEVPEKQVASSQPPTASRVSSSFFDTQTDMSLALEKLQRTKPTRTVEAVPAEAMAGFATTRKGSIDASEWERLQRELAEADAALAVKTVVVKSSNEKTVATTTEKSKVIVRTIDPEEIEEIGFARSSQFMKQAESKSEQNTQ